MSKGLKASMEMPGGSRGSKGEFIRGEKIIKITIEGWEDKPYVVKNVNEFFVVCACEDGEKYVFGAAGLKVLSLAAMEAIQRVVSEL